MAAPIAAFDYRAHYLDAGCADGLLRELCAGVVWRRERVRLFGRLQTVPRLVAWYGEHGVNYRYAGVDHACEGWLPVLHALRTRLAEDFGFDCNLVLLNRYRDGADAMGWHCDDEAGLDPRVASVSLGAERRFLVRASPTVRSTALPLGHGSLLLFDGRLPHALPRTRRPIGERVNLSFRRLDRPGR
jgi:alkylated DNA repair dioxygenase AlkB